MGNNNTTQTTKPTTKPNIIQTTTTPIQIGPQGPIGPMGPQGPQGPKGDKGDKGIDGITTIVNGTQTLSPQELSSMFSGSYVPLQEYNNHLNEYNNFKNNTDNFIQTYSPIDTSSYTLLSDFNTFKSDTNSAVGPLSSFVQTYAPINTSSFATKTELSPFSSFIQTYAPVNTSSFATKTELQSLNSFVQTYAPVDTSSFATKTELSPFSSFVQTFSPVDTSSFATKTDINALTNQINSFSSFVQTFAPVDTSSFATKTELNTIYPSGTIVAFASNTQPIGWLYCDGRAVLKSDYLALFTAIGTTWGTTTDPLRFIIPDLRGIFLRGDGSSGKLSSSTVLGSYQQDTLQNHVHGIGIPVIYNNSYGGYDIMPVGARVGDGSALEVLRGNRGMGVGGVEGGARTSGETRPSNVGVKYFIKT